MADKEKFYCTDSKVETVKKLNNLIENGTGKSGFNLFDTKISDHILEGKEALGWALQGTYVYKEGGTNRVGYPNFYNKCLEEYKYLNNTITDSRVDSGIAWTQPINPEGITSEGWNNPNNVFDGDESTYAEIPAKTQGYIEYNFGQYLSVSGFDTVGQWVNTQVKASNVDVFAVDINGVETLLGTSSGAGNTSTYTTTCTFNPVICNKVRFRITSSDDLAYKIRIKSINITANTTTGYATYKNPNGHQFYNISDKPVIDNIYNQYGIADFYGIDEENERIFLPRNKYFAVTGKAMGNGMTLGLTDGTNNTALTYYTSSTYNFAIYNGDLYGQPTGTTNSEANRPNKNAGIGVTTDPENSGIVLQPNENKYLYYCVGNTEVKQAITNVTEVTTSENDTLPWGYNFYSGDLLAAPVGYVESLGQWNRRQEWQSFYDRAVAKIGQPFADGYIKEHTETYDDYDLVINQDDMTFRLPLLNGSEDLPSNKYDTLTLEASGTRYIAPANGYFSVCKAATKVGQYIQLSTTSKIIDTNFSSTSSDWVRAWAPVKKGHACVPQYTLEGDTISFDFIYAQGNGKLYFKVANAVQNLELLDVGEVMEAVNNHASQVHIIETYQNGTSWYRVYSDGWCEQGAKTTYNGSTASTVSLLKQMRNTNYQLHITPHENSTNNYIINRGGFNLTVNSFDVIGTAGMPYDWMACGYIA